MAVLKTFVAAVAAFALAACGSQANEAALYEDAGQTQAAMPAAGNGAGNVAGNVAGRSGLSDTDFALINRLTWGASPADVAAFQRLGRQGWIDDQLRDGTDIRMPAAALTVHDSLRGDAAPIEQQVVALEAVRFAVTRKVKDPGLTLTYDDYRGPVDTIRRNAVYRSFLRDLYSQDQLREQMTWFWVNHFNVRLYSGTAGAMAVDYVEMFVVRLFGTVGGVD